MPNALDIHREYLGAWNRRDFGAYRELLHPDGRYCHRIHEKERNHSSADDRS